MTIVAERAPRGLKQALVDAGCGTYGGGELQTPMNLLVSSGHHVLLHGRNPAKLDNASQALSAVPGCGEVQSFAADLSRMADVEAC